MKIIDAHCHVFPDSIAEKAAANTGRFYGHQPFSDGKLQSLLSFGEELGICRHVVCSVATSPRQVEPANIFLSDTAKADPSRITALGTMHPDSPDMEGELEQFISLGLKGVKLHPDIQRIPVDAPGMMKIFEMCQDRLPVLCHMGDSRFDYSNPLRIKKVLESFPKLRLVGAHMGGWSIWREAAEMLHRYDGMMVDSSSSLAFMSAGEAVDIMRMYGMDRVMFGTDFPMWDPREEMRLFDGLPITGEEREKVSFGNASELYGICI